jgi:hypothetical protein
LVPWLAAAGPLAYSPDNPPDRDYYFQYSWILPGIFNERVNRRCHCFFGSPCREWAKELFSFWAAARGRAITPVALRLGSVSEDAVTAPIAAYYVERPILVAGPGLDTCGPSGYELTSRSSAHLGV